VDISAELVEFARSSDRERVFTEFFTATLRELEARATFPLAPGTDRGRNWLVVAPWTDDARSSNVSGWLIVSFVRLQRIRVELYLPKGTKPVFDRLRSREAELEAYTGERISWESIPERGAHRVAIYRPCDIEAAPEHLTAAREWAVSTLIRLTTALGTGINSEDAKRPTEGLTGAE
jgi:hypothetical protein